MSRIYDNWERLVGAVLKREELRYLALCPSFTSSRFSFDSHFSASGTSETIHLEASSSSKVQSYHDHVRPIEYTEIKKATKNFRREMPIQEGYPFPVLKGWIPLESLTASKPGHEMAVAVKIWKSDSSEGRQEWRNELNYLSQLRHPNIIKLIGHCEEEDNLLLVYEFMPKGSLSHHLFRRGDQLLSWTTRIKVATDVARGLSFLHEMEIPIIHRDICSAHILLDGEFNAKLSDFGLARDGPTGDMANVSNCVMGTYGYAAPEYVATDHLTTKCDVYGYGVVLLELLCGRRVIDNNRVRDEVNLVDWAKPYLGDKRKLVRVMDTRLEGQYSVKNTRKIAKLVLQCISNMPELRPTMAQVLVALEQL